MVYLAIKIVITLTIREFDIRAAYGELDRLKPRKDPQTVNGERAYQINLGAAHPVDGFPCRVRESS